MGTKTRAMAGVVLVVAAAAGAPCKMIYEDRCFSIETAMSDEDLASDTFRTGVCPEGSTLWGDAEGDDLPLCEQAALVEKMLDGDSACEGTNVFMWQAAGEGDLATASDGTVEYKPGDSGALSADGAADSCAAFPANTSFASAPRDYDGCVVATCDGKLLTTRCDRTVYPGDRFPRTVLPPLPPMPGPMTRRRLAERRALASTEDSLMVPRHPLNFGIFKNALQFKVSDPTETSLCDIDLSTATGALHLDAPGANAVSPGRAVNGEYVNEFPELFKSCATIRIPTGPFDYADYMFTVPVGTNISSLSLKLITSVDPKLVIQLNGGGIATAGLARTMSSALNDTAAEATAYGQPVTITERGVLRLRHPWVKTSSIGPFPFRALDGVPAAAADYTYLDVTTEWQYQQLCSVGFENCTEDLDSVLSVNASHDIVASDAVDRVRIVEVADSGTILCDLDQAFGITADWTGVSEDIISMLECVVVPLKAKADVQYEMPLANVFLAEPESVIAPEDGMWCMDYVQICVNVTAGDELFCAMGLAPFDTEAGYFDFNGEKTTANQYLYDSGNDAQCRFWAGLNDATVAVCSTPQLSNTLKAAEDMTESTLQPVLLQPDWEVQVDLTIYASPGEAMARAFRVDPGPEGAKANVFRVGSMHDDFDVIRGPQLDVVSNPNRALVVSYTVAGADGQPIKTPGKKYEVATCGTGGLASGERHNLTITFFAGTLTITQAGEQSWVCEDMKPMFVPTTEQAFQMSAALLPAAAAKIHTLQYTATETASPTASPSASPTASPSTAPSATPSASPSATPSSVPSSAPSVAVSEGTDGEDDNSDSDGAGGPGGDAVNDGDQASGGSGLAVGLGLGAAALAATGIIAAVVHTRRNRIPLAEAEALGPAADKLDV